MIYTLSMASFKLKNPDNKTELDAQLTGMKSALLAYEAAVAKKKKYRFAANDELIRVRNGVGLATHFKDVKC